mmetsp:Transcript_99649/g.177392  ORF Transcript_99649/g.177392 Transcript_99649/m.177392 type:complete len:417 (-) Transcript_99649:77-1327(-)
MKLVLAAFCAYSTNGAKTYTAGLKTKAVLTTESHAVSQEPANYGKTSCQCIGINDVGGSIKASVGKDQTAEYPADLGAACEAWDHGHHPSCAVSEPLKDDFDNASYIKDNPSWCTKAWCYVDPCECDLPTQPKPAGYLPDGKYHGMPLYYSYATCGNEDSFTSAEVKMEVDLDEVPEVCNKDLDYEVVGDTSCMCIGIDGQPGSNLITINEEQFTYPADLGGKCAAWDDGYHPDCKGDNNDGNHPEWCQAKWCFVDPCSCSLATPPKTSNYISGAKYQGLAVYYSYAACGDSDSYTDSESKNACVNQKSEKECKKLDKCAWNERGDECLGKELVNLCKKKFVDPEQTQLYDDDVDEKVLLEEEQKKKEAEDEKREDAENKEGRGTSEDEKSKDEKSTDEKTEDEKSGDAESEDEKM